VRAGARLTEAVHPTPGNTLAGLIRADYQRLLRGQARQPGRPSR
jgi:hypothetical protein